MNSKLSEHFSVNEFKCRHCGKVINIDPLLIAKLECLRASIGNKPILINSGYRCETHNKNVGGAKNSYHMKGKAVDIRINGDMKELAKMADRIFYKGGVGIYKTFIHVDVGPSRRWFG